MRLFETQDEARQEAALLGQAVTAPFPLQFAPAFAHTYPIPNAPELFVHSAEVRLGARERHAPGQVARRRRWVRDT